MTELFYAYAHHSSGGLSTYIAHVIIRGVIYKILFRLPLVAAIGIAVLAGIWILSRRRKAKSND